MFGLIGNLLGGGGGGNGGLFIFVPVMTFLIVTEFIIKLLSGGYATPTDVPA